MHAETCDTAPAVPPRAVSRRLVVTWQHPIERTIEPVGILQFDGQTYSFHYIRNALQINDFHPFLGFPYLHRAYHSDRLFAFFAQRAMTPRRPDFAHWVRRLGLDDDATPWEQISRSEGRRQGDTVQLFPVPDVGNGQMKCNFLVHGIRHIPEEPIRGDGNNIRLSADALEAHLSALRPGDPLRVLDQPDNDYNPKAILTTTVTDQPLGWVPDLLVDEVHRIPNRGSVNVTAQVVNGPEAGWHLRLLAHMEAVVPQDFRVFDGPKWEPLAVA